MSPRNQHTNASSYVQTGFRVTQEWAVVTWPREPLPLPPRWHQPYELVGTALVPAAQPLPTELLLDPREEIGETYLHLAELDLADESAIAKFVDRHGVLGVRFRGYETLGPFRRVNPTALRALKTSVRAARKRGARMARRPDGHALVGHRH